MAGSSRFFRSCAKHHPLGNGFLVWQQLAAPPSPFSAQERACSPGEQSEQNSKPFPLRLVTCVRISTTFPLLCAPPLLIWLSPIDVTIPYVLRFSPSDCLFYPSNLSSEKSYFKRFDVRLFFFFRSFSSFRKNKNSFDYRRRLEVVALERVLRFDWQLIIWRQICQNDISRYLRYQ